MGSPFLMFFAPVLILFELAQLFVAERFLGVKQIERGTDPRIQPMSEFLAFGWSMGIIVTWLWMFCMLGMQFGQGQIVCMLVVSLFGYALRRMSRMKWILVTLSFEGAIRIGMLVSLLSLTWQNA